MSYEQLQEKARTIARGEYRSEHGVELPEFLKKLDYDGYQSIHFRPQQGPWQNERLRFTFQFFHRGFLYQDPVRIHLLENGGARDFKFTPEQFIYGNNRFPAPVPGDLDFAGLKVLYPINAPGKQDEVAAFLGASYFRLIGAHQRYGASARGLAINTAEPTGEEFPRFLDFWIQKPGSNDDSVTLLALLDSPSVAGAYRFVIQPGDAARIDVTMSLFIRKAIQKLGLAPLTSMFLAGENRTRLVPDFRPEVHDSDGLLVQGSAGEWLWRPLINPENEHSVTRFPLSGLKGFGLLQRDRNFDHYQDLVSRYETRPSLWVKPLQGWAAGALELVEIPSPSEWHDNVVAYWVPDQKLERGQEYQLEYAISATLAEPEESKLLRVEATRITPRHENMPPRFVIDFNSGQKSALAADAPVEATVQASRGTIRNLVTEKNAVTGGWRTFFDYEAKGKEPGELRLFLHLGNEVLSETWVYRDAPQ